MFSELESLSEPFLENLLALFVLLYFLVNKDKKGIQLPNLECHNVDHSFHASASLQNKWLINAHLNPDDDLRIEFVSNTLGNLIEDSLEEGNEKENDEEEILMEESDNDDDI
ncbi:hypothetical protein RhiirB3_447407 [Rhizophagus irregularis]|nr:hypothetical protein RhiirB3_447407 [Rhizophagus irregularis]